MMMMRMVVGRLSISTRKDTLKALDAVENIVADFAVMKEFHPATTYFCYQPQLLNLLSVTTTKIQIPCHCNISHTYSSSNFFHSSVFPHSKCEHFVGDSTLIGE
ncbi:uncharacterized protein LOC132640841 [Lycium barbarum]|uniref:uncharacterized protein LOC132640841 n=1 Tax=Lycium barbarum TaxID=112863 RepID=UPI00293F68CD|nr:uncharacterized protein LOC132640841 [Lycium barbarum]XP_060213602.1 uncharacterized protein LOC132640841 [Lycium barbarum]